MRWRQCRETGKLIPIDEQAARRDHSEGKGTLIVRDNFEPFRSVVDGSIIRTHRDLEAHNKRNKVTNIADFGPEFIEKAAKKREDAGKRSKEETLKVRQHLYEQILRAENGLPLRKLQ